MLGGVTLAVSCRSCFCIAYEHGRKYKTAIRRSGLWRKEDKLVTSAIPGTDFREDCGIVQVCGMSSRLLFCG